MGLFSSSGTEVVNIINVVFVMVRISRDIGGGQDFEYVNKA